MTVHQDSAVLGYPAIPEHRDWLRLTVGVFALMVGVAAFAWPDATVRVIGFLFGLNLVLTGSIHAVLLLFVPGYPMLFRVLGITFGVLTALVGILCLRNITASLALLLVIVAIGWLLDGLVQIFMAIGRSAEGARGWRITSGVIMVLGAVAVLVWPHIGLATFVFVGATILVFVGIAQVVIAIAGMRAARA
ncbi:HdeD family acid-resistance protein [Krasilnikovia sp. MM14-A1259]|uniref:HdeD family acid-resistance protein n=1 Tax=Krasilnikovia sp. MM14-A1259 TaxID=3373539 RepID=UPI003807911C